MKNNCRCNRQPDILEDTKKALYDTSLVLKISYMSQRFIDFECFYAEMVFVENAPHKSI